MRLPIAPAVSMVCLLCAAPGSAAVLMRQVTGVLLPGTDTAGVLGTPGADLAGLPFTFRLYYRDAELFIEDGGDYSGSTYAAAGRIGGLRIPFHGDRGSISGLQTPEGPFYLGNAPDPLYPSISAEVFLELDPDDDIDWNEFSSIAFYAPTSLGGAVFAAGRVDSFSTRNFGTGPIPEPSAWLLLLAGFGAIGVAIRTRRTRVAVTYS